MDIRARRAVEALRCGVPSEHVVEVLGSAQPAAEERFAALLNGAPSSTDGAGAPVSRSLLVAGGFGAGKSHLLNHFEKLALAADFVCSRVTVSKETPFFHPDRLFRAAVRCARVPGRSGPLFEELCAGDFWRRPDSGRFMRLVDGRARNGEIASMFPASLWVYESDPDAGLRADIEGWWSGEKMLVSRVRDPLRQNPDHRKVECRAPKAHEIARQRLRFAADFIRARYRGWVVLFDELELVAQYSLLQRARSYAALAGWFGADGAPFLEDVVVAGAITDDFAAAKIRPPGGKVSADFDAAPAALRRKPRYEPLAGDCAAGMRLIEQDALPLAAPDPAVVADIGTRLRRLYSEAYGWDAPEPRALEGPAEGSRRMRHYIRAPIAEWDILRLSPGRDPRLVVDEQRPDYEERLDLEAESEVA